MFDILTYFGIFWQAAIVLGFACVLGSTAWGIVETKPRKSTSLYDNRGRFISGPRR